MASIRKRGNAFQIRVSAGYDVAGHQIIKTMTWTPPEGWHDRRAWKEVERKAAVFEEQIHNGITDSGNTRFADFAERWMKDYAQEQLRPRTVARYRELLKRINKEIGHLPLCKIRPMHLMNFYNKLREIPAHLRYCCKCGLQQYAECQGIKLIELSKLTNLSYSTILSANAGKYISKQSADAICDKLGVALNDLFQLKDDQVLSTKTIQHYHRLISSILSDAVNWQFIPYNPCNRMDAPKVVGTETMYLDETQSQKLLRLLENEPCVYQCAISTLLLTGLRRGELLGMEWRDIDFQNRTIFISRTSQYLAGQGVFTDITKNKTSKRFVCISEITAVTLLRQLQWQQSRANLQGLKWTESYRVITNEKCEPMRPDTLTHWFHSFICRSEGLPSIHLHSLRHTYATLCIAKGVPLTAVAAQLGHANVATTATIYAHAIKSAQLVAADKMDILFSNIVSLPIKDK